MPPGKKKKKSTKSRASVSGRDVLRQATKRKAAKLNVPSPKGKRKRAGGFKGTAGRELSKPATRSKAASKAVREARAGRLRQKTLEKAAKRVGIPKAVLKAASKRGRAERRRAPGKGGVKPGPKPPPPTFTSEFGKAKKSGVLKTRAALRRVAKSKESPAKPLVIRASAKASKAAAAARKRAEKRKRAKAKKKKR